MADKSSTLAEAVSLLHPSSEELVAHHDGRLPRPQAARIEEHLSRCRTCREQAAEIPLFLDPGEGAEEVPLDEAAAEEMWRRITSPAARPARAEEREKPPARPVVLRSGPWLRGLAAVLLLTTLLFALAWNAERREAAVLAEGDLNVPIETLLPSSFFRAGNPAGSETPQPVAVAPGAVLILTPALEPAAVEHDVEIVEEGGEAVWSGSGLRPTDRESFHLRLPRSLRPGGTYRIHIHPPAREPGDEGEGITVLITLRAD